MRRRCPRGGTATSAAAAACCVAVLASQPPAAATESGGRALLHEGESATLGAHLRVTLTALVPAGSCPGGRAECVEVAPPQAQIDVAVDGVHTQLVLRLFGARSNAERAGAWIVRVVDVQPVAFSRSDVALGRAALTLQAVAAGE